MDKEDFIDKINKAAAIINNASLSNQKNLIIVSPKIAYVLEEMIRKENLRKERIEKLKKLNELE